MQVKKNQHGFYCLGEEIKIKIYHERNNKNKKKIQNATKSQHSTAHAEFMFRKKKIYENNYKIAEPVVQGQY